MKNLWSSSQYPDGLSSSVNSIKKFNILKEKRKQKKLKKNKTRRPKENSFMDTVGH